MTQNGHARVCPTRIDGRAALFVHRVAKVQCQDRQRGHYHKCYACLYNNAYVAVHGLPTSTSLEASVESPAPAAPAAAAPTKAGLRKLAPLDGEPASEPQDETPVEADAPKVAVS